ncbi:carbon storage regulator [Arhodomonas sp. AD133]|uniref:carbon storage regulator n=1 Tax=Arhodomonas sp. AD133 TaxID=3415009 RepID=UPI003EB7F08C
MLSLTRRYGEALVIGEDIRLEILPAGGMAVKLRVDAPKAVPVVREELLQGSSHVTPERVSALEPETASGSTPKVTYRRRRRSATS